MIIIPKIDKGGPPREIPEVFDLEFLHSFSGCDTVSAISGFSKSTLVNKLCETDKAKQAMDASLDIRGKKDDIIKVSCELFKLMFHGRPPNRLWRLEI